MESKGIDFDVLHKQKLIRIVLGLITLIQQQQQQKKEKVNKNKEYKTLYDANQSLR